MRVRLLPAWIAGTAIMVCGCSTSGAAPAQSQHHAAAAAQAPHAKAPSPSSSPSAKPSPVAKPSAAAKAPATAKPKTQAKETPAAPALQLGDHGPAVYKLQRRLSSLGYWIGSANGQFGDTTQQAVYALQKEAGLTRDGVAGPETMAALARGPRPSARTHSGHVIEVDLSRDLLLIVSNGKVADILNTSTAGGYAYPTTGGGTAIATTPTGVFRIERAVDGMDVSPLGQLWRPRYFYGGYAIHGDGDVPPYPVSHGCVRISDAAIDWVWATGQAPIGTEVDIYG